jgi:predicted nuclease of predicted toxin-antitoxin system
MKLLFDESLSQKLVDLLCDLFPGSESALRNGLARAGDRRILEYASAHGFTLVSTDTDFERLLAQMHGAIVVILRSCNYPTDVAAQVLRRNAIRIAELPNSNDSIAHYRSVISGQEAIWRASGLVQTPHSRM